MNTSIDQAMAPTQTAVAADPQTIVNELGDETVRALGLLDKAPRGIPELAIASFDYGTRMRLEAYGLITFTRREDDFLAVTITPFGREVIELCASDIPAVESTDLAAAVERAEDLLSLANESSVRTLPA